jgi:hypothetical protein
MLLHPSRRMRRDSCTVELERRGIETSNASKMSEVQMRSMPSCPIFPFSLRNLRSQGSSGGYGNMWPIADPVAQFLAAHEWQLRRRWAARPLRLTKRIFPALASLRLLLSAHRSSGLRLLGRKNRFAYCRAHSGDAWEPDYEALPNGVLARCRNLQFAKPCSSARRAGVTTRWPRLGSKGGQSALFATTRALCHDCLQTWRAGWA